MVMPKDPIKREEALCNYRVSAQKLALDPIWQDSVKKANQKKAQDPVWQFNHRVGCRERSKNPGWVRKNKERIQKLLKDPEYRSKQKTGCQKINQNPEYKFNRKISYQRRSRNLIWLYNLIERNIGGFWYGNVRYPDPSKYCELWRPDLWHRIDEAQNYQSILSGKTKFDNGGRALSRHHVYYQRKACCEWDEDATGYYAWIDVGTPKNPNRVKYYIPGDPNKFVLLTMSEHRMIDKDKIKWIKLFENLIETNLGGICYLPKGVE